MSGVKGLSGRKSVRDEEKRLRVIEKGWDRIEEFLDSPSISLKAKVDLAAKFVARDIPQELEHSGQIKVVQMGDVKVADRLAEFNVG